MCLGLLLRMNDMITGELKCCLGTPEFEECVKGEVYEGLYV